jgi:hypothetical protein
VDRLRRGRERIDQQCTQIQELTAIFTNENSAFGGTAAPDLPPDLRSQVLDKVNDVVAAISAEYCAFDPTEFDRLLSETHEIQSAIERELAVLSRLPSSDWDPPDDLQVFLDEFSLRHRAGDLRADAALYSIEIPCASEPLQILERRVNAPLPPPRAQALATEIANLIGLLRRQRN